MPFRTLRGRLIALVAALLALVIGGVAVVSTRVVHHEIRRIEVEAVTGGKWGQWAAPLREHYTNRGSWDVVQPVLDRVAKESGSGVLLFDGARQLVAVSPPAIRGTNPSMAADESLTWERATPSGRFRGVIRGPQAVIRDRSGATAGFLFLLPADPALAQPQPIRIVDVWFFWTFLIAAIAGVLMAVGIARWTTRPILRLTDATRRMEGGDLSVRVAPSGGRELAELAESFNAMAGALDRNEELRRRMVSDVAHELRAPLTNIRGELESMQDGLTQPTPERLESLHEETMQLARLVDDLQDLALAEAGRLELEPQRVELAALVRRAVTGVERLAREHSVRIVEDGPSDLVVAADPRRAVQIVTNLLSNAVTHMQRPGEVRVTWAPEESMAVVKVIDEGVGIPADDLAKIFERFYRVDASRSRTTGGAGLGLSIVRQLVAAHGGRVWAESEVGRGSTFAFTLPVE
jgi:two-component system sensor histidine kinase BaeS